MGLIVNQVELAKLAKLEPGSKAALKKHLKRAGIPFRELNGNLFTTVDAMTATLVGRASKRKAEPDWDATA